jgi:PASTA domain/Bacterial Ig domain
VAVHFRWVSRGPSPAARRLRAVAILSASACGIWAFAVAPGAHAGTTCAGGAPTALLTGTYSGTWTYSHTIPPGSGSPEEAEQITLSWSESYDGQTGCWSLTNATGSASLSGTGDPPDGSDCSATIKLAPDGADNFLSDQMSSSGQYPYLTQTDPATGQTDLTHWFVDEYVPNFYGDPEGVLRTTDHKSKDWCYQPLNGYQPTINSEFAGTDCHVGPYFAGGSIDFLTFPVNGANTRGDSCSHTLTDAAGDRTSETLQQSMTLSSETPTCSDVSSSTTADQPVTIQLVCTNPSNSQLRYFLGTSPRHAAKVSIDGSELTYTPVDGFTGTDTFTYFAEPVNGLRGNPATVTVTVVPPTGSPKPPKNPGAPNHGKHTHANKGKHHKRGSGGKGHRSHQGHRRHGALACKVPAVQGRTLARAKKSLRRAHCGVGRVTARKSSVVAKGHVIASSPTAATRHQAGTKVRLTVSLGR